MCHVPRLPVRCARLRRGRAAAGARLRSLPRRLRSDTLSLGQALAEALPNGRLEVFTGYGHGVNLLLPEQCARVVLGASLNVIATRHPGLFAEASGQVRSWELS